MNSSNWRCHASPSSATFAAPSVERKALDPSGNAVAVGRSVFRYSSPSAVEVRLQLGVGRRADPERVPGGEDLVREARGRQPVDRPDRAAEPVVPLEHADPPAVLREQCGTGERVDAAADEDRVESGHRARLYCLDMSRRHLC